MDISLEMLVPLTVPIIDTFCFTDSMNDQYIIRIDILM